MGAKKRKLTAAARRAQLIEIGRGVFAEKGYEGTSVEEIAGRQGRTVKPEQFPDKGYFYRSDQFNFAKIGVPAIYADSGVDFVDRPAGWGKEQMDAWVEVHYHQPTDELNDSWNFEGYVEDTLLLYEAGQIVAERPEVPAWNPGDEFEAGRLEALAALE